MRKTIALSLAAAALAGCGSSPGPWLDTGVDEALLDNPTPTEIEPIVFDPAMYENVLTFQLGTELRPPAKTIDWPTGGVTEGTTFLKGQVSVDAVTRQDADDFYNVGLRLRSRLDRPLAVEWMIAFFDQGGKRKIGLNDYRGPEAVFRSTVIEPFGLVSISNACRVKGALTFRLYVRAKGGRDAGEPDSGTLEEAVTPSAPPPAAAASEDDLLDALD